jgi:hypothetical protein
VGGHFENYARVPIEGPRVLLFFCNEDGRAKGLPVNRSKLLGSVYSGEVRGPVVIAARDLIGGESYSLDDSELEMLAAIEGGLGARNSMSAARARFRMRTPRGVDT